MCWIVPYPRGRKGARAAVPHFISLLVRGNGEKDNLGLAGVGARAHSIRMKNAVRLADRAFGLRFVAPDTEVAYRRWRIPTTIPFVRVGMIASAANWLIYLITLQVIQPTSVSRILPGVVALAWPAILATLAVSYWPRVRPMLMPLTGLTNCLTGAVIAWQIHQMLPFSGAPAVTSAVNLILMFFAFTIFRMPPGLAVLAVVPYLSLVLAFLSRDYIHRVVSRTEFGAHVAIQLIGFLTGLLVCLVLEVVTRRTYRTHCIIQDQQEALEHSREQIRRYVPPAVAERIVAGEEASIDTPLRRRVTVLFADVVGFTDIADRVDAEVITQVVNEYMAAMADIVASHNGTLNEFSGDGLMALFGAPAEMAPEDQVRAAIAAAQAMQDAMPALNEQWRKLGLGGALQIRIGINTGMVSVGSFGSKGRMTYTAIGLQTNIAARIQALAAPGGILISDASWQLVRDDVPCEPHGEFEVKGLHFPVKVFSPRGTKARGPEPV